MRILHILHSFPPQGLGGVEHYVLQLAAGQLAQGHEVAALYPLILPQGARCRLIKDRYPLVGWAGVGLAGKPRPSKKVRSLEVFKVTNPNRNSLYWTAFNREAEQRVLEAVRDFTPDVVHIHHLYWLSVRIIGELKAQFPALRIVMTLHDYWYACYKGVLRTPDGRLCSGPDRLKCMGCIEQKGITPAGLREFSHANPFFKPLQGIISVSSRGKLERSGRGDSALRRQMANAWFFVNREREMLSALSQADALIAPSRYLASWHEKWLASRGIKRDVRVLPNAIQPSRASPAVKASKRPFIFGFIGQLAPHKGAHHLLSGFREAVVSLLDKETVKRDELPMLSIYGPSPLPDYLKKLHALSAVPNPLIVDRISFEGRFEPRELSRVLGSLDVLVIPSLWPENAPLVVLEAVAAGVPVLAPRLGGLPEMLDSSGKCEGDGDDGGLQRVARGWLYGKRDTLPSDDELKDALLAVVKVLEKKPKKRKPLKGAFDNHIKALMKLYM